MSGRESGRVHAAFERCSSTQAGPVSCSGWLGGGSEERESLQSQLSCARTVGDRALRHSEGWRDPIKVSDIEEHPR